MRGRTRAGRLLGIALAFLLLPSALPGHVLARGTGPRGAAEVVKIKIVDNRFRNGSVTIDRGTVVKWTNRGDNIHTSTSDTGVWDSGSLTTDESFRRTFRRAGTFDYFCAVHPTMTGTITVT